MTTDKELLKWYSKGFSDELNGSSAVIPQNTYLELRAYKIGTNHAIMGDEVRSFDCLTNEEILKIIKS
jgi:hypothetical protein